MDWTTRDQLRIGRQIRIAKVPAAYGNLALLNSSKTKHNASRMANPMKESATHV
jgi:hypothetical protein